jgi:nucleotidyltransferase substrate binding protein (TIGR01987 family)
MGSANVKLTRALDTLQKAISYHAQESQHQDLSFLSVAKAFEVAVEYAWRELKQRVQEEGLDVLSPKAAIREAARLGMIEQAETWLDYVQARNAGVHDYFSMSNDEYVAIAKEFLESAIRVFQ